MGAGLYRLRLLARPRVTFAGNSAENLRLCASAGPQRVTSLSQPVNKRNLRKLRADPPGGRCLALPACGRTPIIQRPPRTATTVTSQLPPYPNLIPPAVLEAVRGAAEDTDV